MILGPAPINTTAPRFEKFRKDFSNSYEKSLELPAELEKVARQEVCTFLDISTFAAVGEDGIALERREPPGWGRTVGGNAEQKSIIAEQ